MPSSAGEGWTGWLRDELRQHENERDSGSERPPAPARYDVRERLGEGTSAVVFRAWDRELNRPVALKLLRETACLSEVARQRFRREAQAAAGLAHPNLIAVHDVGEESGRPYLVMELVDGRPLGEVLRRDSIDLASRVRLLEKVARGVAAAHDKGIIHRDLKPANILVTAADEPKVGDFGLAHLVDSSMELTRTGTPLGTPLYMAPEQVEGRTKDLGPATDVYGLGAILYEAVTGRTPHTATSIAELYGRILREDPQSPRRFNAKLPGNLQTIILKAMAKEPGRRYPTAAALADDLRRYLEGDSIQARPDTLPYRLYRRLRRHPAAWTLAIASCVVGFVAVLWWRERSASIETLRQQARISLNAALDLRRQGANAKMQDYLPAIESAYRRAPRIAEVEYLMGRMRRALMEDEKALEHQERSLRADPEFAPALYERAVLLSKEYGREFRKAVGSRRALEPGAGFGSPGPTAEDLERSHAELGRLRERILLDCENLDRLLQRGGLQGGRVTDAHVLAARGVFAFYRRDYHRARAELEAAVKKDPLLEEVWETSGRLAQAQAAQAGTTEEKERYWRLAETCYSEGLSHDRGYLPHYIGLGETRLERGLHRVNRQQDPLGDYSAAESDLSRALELRPGWSEALLKRGMVRTLRGIRRMTTAKDPTPEYAAAEEDLDLAQKVDRDSLDLRIWRGYLQTHRGVYWMRLDKDPTPEWGRAERSFVEALGIDPRSVQAWRYRCYVEVKLAYYRETLDADPLPHYEKAEAHLQAALSVDPQSFPAWDGLGDVRARRAAWQAKTGRDPSKALSDSESAFTRALGLLDTNAWVWAARADVLRQRGIWRETSGDKLGAKNDYTLAVLDYEEAFRLQPALQSQFMDGMRTARQKMIELAPEKR